MMEASVKTKVKPIRIQLKDPWIVGAEHLDFRQASTYWVFGKRFTGKSSLVEAIATHYLNHGATIYDIYSSRDNENLAWCRSPYKDIFFVCGDSIELQTTYPWVKASEFDLEEAEKHQIVIAAPAFFKDEYEQNITLSNILDALKRRIEWDKVDCLLVRESSRLIFSRIIAGKVKNRMEAEADFLDMIQEAYHTGLAVALDSLRPFAIDVNVREIANYCFVKSMGRLFVPKEFHYLMRYVDPTWMRRMKVDRFILYTDSDNVNVGWFNEVPWHVNRGEDILKTLGIKVLKNGEESEPKTNKKVDKAMHIRMVELREGGLSFQKIAAELDDMVSWQTVQRELGNHQRGECACLG